MFEEARNTIDKTTRRGLALYFGTVNLAGETVTHPSKVLRGIERRGERVLQQIETNNRQIRRSFSLLERRTTETANSVRGTARATVGLASSLADDATAPAPSRRKRSNGRTRVALAGRTATGTERRASTRSSATTRTAKQRSQAAEKAARTRALNERKAELKKTRTVAKARATRAKNETKTGFDKAQANVQHGLQAVGHRLEDVGERVERAVDKVAS